MKENYLEKQPALKILGKELEQLVGKPLSEVGEFFSGSVSLNHKWRRTDRVILIEK